MTVAAQIGSFIRPKTVSIFAAPFTGKFGGAVKTRFTQFLIEDARIQSPDRVSFDLSKSRSRSQRYQWPRSPIESITVDNVIKDPRVVNISGTLSATPLGFLSGAVLAGAFGAIVRRDIQILEKLHALADRGEPLMVVAPEFSESSMGIVSIDDRHGEGNKIEISMVLEKVRIVSPLLVEGAIDLDSLLSGVFSEESIGSQAVTSVPEPAGLAGGVGG